MLTILTNLNYDQGQQIFSSTVYSVDQIQYIKYISVEAIIKQLSIYTICIQRVVQSKDITISTHICQFVVAVGVLLTNYFTKLIKPIQQYIAISIAIDICSICPYILFILRFTKLRKNNEGEQFLSVVKDNQSTHSVYVKSVTKDQISDNAENVITNPLIPSQQELKKQFSEIMLSLNEEELVSSSANLSSKQLNKSDPIESSVQSSDLEDDLLKQRLTANKKAKPKKPTKLIEKGRIQIENNDSIQKIETVGYEQSVGDFFKK
ncbi:Hypothetical_protein [Hexamita inflata]|uniref:Hypothetical_protein n=1 Tax=Hexamita inflata TaxID=28002 RepID=A0AA86QLP2_9EUKA|nr:Hypothetical protein HINF_LOCUS45776 [Hexamita inflata]CAI9965896.1 Hypothetical protein HINF_LOCUS53541 [Hexamita inflata]